MRYFILLTITVLNAHALTKEQAQRAMNGEDYNESKKPKKVAVSECDYSGDCQFDEYCHKERQSDSKGVCIKKSKD